MNVMYICCSINLQPCNLHMKFAHYLATITYKVFQTVVYAKCASVIITSTAMCKLREVLLHSIISDQSRSQEAQTPPEIRLNNSLS